jgi:hypothetical protein
MIRIRGFGGDGNFGMRPGNASMNSVSRQKIALVTVILGLTLLLTTGARGWATAHKGQSGLAIVATDLLPGGSKDEASGLNLGFAMADFTGDTHPDLATVELKKLDSANAQYLIEIRLTEGRDQFLKLRAPFGGVVITPQDVTGDGNLDLVIRSARSHVPVAVFLNDGHGHFFAADPNAFTKSLRESTSEQYRAPNDFYYSATLVSPKSYSVYRQNNSLRDRQRQSDLFVPASYGAPRLAFLQFGSNRAPPVVA